MLTNVREVSCDFDPATRTALARIRMPFYGVHGAAAITGVTLKPAGPMWKWPEADPNAPACPDAVVIDLRSSDVVPCLAPRLMTSDGLVVFDATEQGKGGSLRHPAAVYVRYVERISTNAALEPAGPAAMPPRLITVVPANAQVRADFLGTVVNSFDHPVLFTNCRGEKDRPDRIILSPEAVAYLQAHPETQKTFTSGRIVVVASGRDEAMVP
jgi:hypothetical protein